MIPFKNLEPCDRSGWFPGPWDQEPDQLEWIDTESGYQCAIIRVSHSGHLCGYVQVPEDHLLVGKSYDSRVPIPVGWMERSISVDEKFRICQGKLSKTC